MSAIGSSRYGKLEGDERNWLLVFKGVSFAKGVPFAAAPARLRALARPRETRAMGFSMHVESQYSLPGGGAGRFGFRPDSRHLPQMDGPAVYQTQLVAEAK